MRESLSQAIRSSVLAAVVCLSIPLTFGPTLPLDEYWLLVEETRSLVVGLTESPPEARRLQLDAAVETWSEITQVSLPDGSLVTVDHSYLVSLLQEDYPDLVRLENHLTALLDAAAEWPLLEEPSLDADVIESILARPEFEWRETPASPLEQWWQRLWDAIREFLRNLSPGGTAEGDGGPLASYLFTALGTLLLVLILAFVVGQLVADFAAEREIDSLEDDEGTPLTAATALKRAQTLASRGDRRTSVRYLYLSLLLMLEERGVLRYDRSLTNQEYLRSVADNPELSGPLRKVVAIFERVWYGNQPLDDADYDDYASQVSEARRGR